MPSNVIDNSLLDNKASFCSEWSLLPAFEEHTFVAGLSDYAIVIPVWNEGTRILDQLSRLRELNHGLSVVLVDGGSSDGSTEHSALIKLGVSTLLVTQERGLGTALQLGIAYSLSKGCGAVITIDGNGKDDVRRIPVVASKLDEGFDLVQASRFLPGAEHRNTPRDRLLGIKYVICPLLGFRSGYRYTDPTNGFKGISRKLLLDQRVQPFRSNLRTFSFQLFLNYVAPRIGVRVCEIPASRHYPDDGTVPTKIHGFSARFKLLSEFLQTIIGRYDVAARTKFG